MLKTILIVVLINLIIADIKGQTDIVENGYSIIYYKDGKISSEGYMRNGKPDGYWKTYYTTGVLKSEGNRKNFLLDSTWIFYNSYGDTLEKMEYLYGKKNGYSYTFNTDKNDKPENIGKIISKELYVNDKKEGIAKYYYNDGLLYRISHYIDNRLNDYTYEFDRKGNVILVLRYSKGILVERDRINRYNENNERDGLWKEFYEDLKLKSEINYEHGKKNGIFREFDHNGKLIIRLKYENDNIVENTKLEEDSVSIKYEYDNLGNIIFSGTYKEYVPVGIHRFFNQEGNVINAFIFNDNGIKISEGIVNMDGSKSGKWKNFYTNGSIRSEGNYVNNQENGRWKFYYVEGFIEQEGDYKNGMYNGIWTWYYDNGKVRKEERYFNGKEDGEVIEYDIHSNIILKGEYLDGEREGEWLYMVNEHKEIGSYVTGLRNGKWKYFYSSDNIKFEGNYIQGNADGKHRYYYDNGNIKEEQFYSQGIKVKHWKKYDEEGNLIITISYDRDKEVRINGERIDNIVNL